MNVLEWQNDCVLNEEMYSEANVFKITGNM
jgi:hypothetical protein